MKDTEWIVEQPTENVINLHVFDTDVSSKQISNSWVLALKLTRLNYSVNLEFVQFLFSKKINLTSLSMIISGLQLFVWKKSCINYLIYCL